MQKEQEKTVESVKEPENRNRLKQASSFTRPVCAASAKQSRLAAPENGRSMTAGVKEPEVHNSKPVRVLLAGAHSYIGNRLEQYQEEAASGIQIHKVSASDGAWKGLDFRGYDAVVMLAALVHKKEKKLSAAEYDRVNCDLAVEIAKKAKLAGVRQFVFFSTMAVYGAGAEKITKETPPAPDTLYGKSKYKAEQQLQLLEEPDFTVAVIRPPMVYGPDCPGNYRVLERYAPLFRIFPDTGNRRSMIEITELCRAVTEIILTGQGGVFLPQDEQYHNTGKMIQELRAQAGKKTCLTGAFNWLLVPLARRVRILRKIFGSQYYA